MAKQAVDCRNMVNMKYGTPTPLSGYSKKINVRLLKNYSQHVLSFLTYYTHFIIGRKIRIIRIFYYWT